MRPAFDTRQIVETKRSMLRARAITHVRAITADGIVYVMDAADIRYHEASGRGEVRVTGLWLPVTDLGIESWANEEALNWRRPDGTVGLTYVSDEVAAACAVERAARDEAFAAADAVFRKAITPVFERALIALMERSR